MKKTDPYNEIFNDFARETLLITDDDQAFAWKLKTLLIAWNRDVALKHELKVIDEINKEIATESAANVEFEKLLLNLSQLKTKSFGQHYHYILNAENINAGGAAVKLIVESVDPLKLRKLGTLEKPAMMNVHTEDQALDVLAYCSSRGWQVIVEVRPEDPEDLYNLYYLQMGIVPE